jgi:hypothetical protein
MTEQWKKAQDAERRFHSDPFEKGYPSYFRAYQQYFYHLQINFDLQNKSILEIGPADYPALGYCVNANKAHIIEPMPSSILEEIINSKADNFIRLQDPNSNLPEDNTAEIILKVLQIQKAHYDQIWIFNVLQHVIDPDFILSSCKEIADQICIFEPINTGLSDCHIHAFTPDYFIKKLGPGMKIYPPNKYAKDFHTHECMYGIWERES